MDNKPETLTLSILQLDAFINLWLCKTRIEIEQLTKGNETLREDMLRSQLSSPLEAWHKIKELVKKCIPEENNLEKAEKELDCDR